MMAIRSISKALAFHQSSLPFRQLSTRKFSDEAQVEGKNVPDIDEQNRKKELDTKIKTLENESLQYKDLYIRAVAEQENIRKRLTKEIENEGNYSITKFAKEMVEVSDNLNRALENSKTKSSMSEAKMLQDLVEGVSMTRDILNNAFAKFHISEIKALGEKFDPNLHEALFAYEESTKEPGTVGQVLTTGFKIKDRLLRPAKVGVIKK